MTEHQPTYRAFRWHDGQPTPLVVDEQTRRAFQKDMMRHNGVGESGEWLEFKRVDPVSEVIRVLREKMGLEVHELK